MESKVLNYIKQNNLINAGSSLVLGVSGGSDSMALLHFFATNFEKLFIKKITICHINHMLRGEESDFDERLVKDFSRKLNVGFEVLHVDIKELAKNEKGSIELIARNQRYAFFEKFNEENTIIATAHHLNDNIETFLYNSIRGTSINGLCGIPVKRGNIIRPFLCVSKKEIEDYCSKNNVPFSVDYTNFSVDYTRNRIRNIIVPEFSKINISYEENFRKMFELINEDRKYIEDESNNLYKKICINNRINLNCMSDLSEFILKKVIRLYLIKNSLSYNKKVIDLILNIVLNKSGKLEISKNVYIVYDFGYLYIDKFKKLEKSDEYIPLKNGEYKFLGKSYIHIEIVEIENYVKNEKKLFQCILDYDKIKTAVFRTRKEFDFVVLKDRNIKKSLKKFLNEEKVDKNIRYHLPLLALDNRVIYIHNHYIDKAFSIEKSTKEVILFNIGGLDF